MSKYRTDLLEGDRLPQDFIDAIQEFISTYASPNFTVTLLNPTTLRVPAGTDNAQVGIALNGKWRYITANADCAAPGGLTVGDNPIFVTSKANSFGPNGSPPPTELDSTDYSFFLLVLPSGSTPTGTGTQAQWRQVGVATWDGSQFTAIKLSIGSSATPEFFADVIARDGLAQQVKIGSIGGVAGVALGSSGDVTAVRDTTGGNNLKVNVPLNASGFQVGGVALKASHLSDGTTGSGAIALAVSPALTGTPTVPTAAVDTSTTQAASTAFVLGQASASGDGTPSMDGTAARGTSTHFARADHVHPTDASRAPLASPALTGTPTVPTAAVDTNTTQAASTAFVIGQGYLKSASAATTYAPLASPAFSGTPTAPTPATADNSTRLATTAYVQAQPFPLDTNVVHLANAETLTGVKLFNAGPRWGTQSVSSVQTLVDGTAAVVLTDTTAGSFTITLPASPSAGSWFRFVDLTGQWATNNLTIGRNGKLIDGVASNLVLSAAYGNRALYYDGTGWHSTETSALASGDLAGSYPGPTIKASVGLTGVPTAPTASADTNTTQIASTAYVLGQAGTATPLIDGTAAAGTSTRFARQDHVHPTDTSRAPLASPGLTGSPTAPTAAVDTNTTQIATTAFVLAQAAAATPLMDGAAAVGTATRFARADHVHPSDTSRAPLASPGLTGTPTAPTPTAGDNTTKIATTAFVATSFAPLASPALTGSPTAPTPATGDNSTLLATTAFVKAQAYSTDASVVHLALAETITGVKLFNVGFRLATQSVSGTTTLTDGSAEVVLVDTTAAAFTITLPAAPAAGSSFTFIDSAGQWGTHALTVGRNGKTIDGSASNVTLSVGNAVVQFYYTGTAWVSQALGAQVGGDLAGALPAATIKASVGLTGTPTAPTAAVDTNTTQIASTAFVLGQASAVGDGTPSMDGAAARGTSTHFARADHVHPTDTSLAPLASPHLTGTPLAPTAVTNTNTTQVATTAFVLAQIGATAVTGLSGVSATTGTGTTIVFAASPALTGTPTAPTAATSTNTTQIASTAFVLAQIGATPVTGLSGVSATTGTGTTIVFSSSPTLTGTPLVSSQIGVGSVYSLSAGSDGTNSTTSISNAGSINVVRATDSYMLRGSLVGDTQYRFYATTGGAMHWGDGTNLDVQMVRDSSGALVVSGGAFKAGDAVWAGATASTVAGGTTLAVDASAATYYSVTVNVSGATTLTVANPTNTPGSSYSMDLTIRIANSAGSGGTTLTWGANYTFGSFTKPTSVNFGSTVWCYFRWDPVDSRWRCISMG